MVAANVTLGGAPLNANPEDIHWDFKIKTSDRRMMGGKVIQILGATMGDITVVGHYGPGRRDLGDTEGWQNEERLQEQVRAWAMRVSSQGNSVPLRFTYAPRKWDFRVFIRSMSPVHLAIDEVNPAWAMVLVPVDKAAFDVVRGVKDLYIERLLNGIGWSQSEYNGPSQAEVDKKLGGLSIKQYLEQQWGDAYTYGMGPDGPVAGVTVNPNPFFGGATTTIGPSGTSRFVPFGGQSQGTQ